MQGKKILLIISGGIAAVKSLELIRRFKERGAGVECVLTEAATRLVTPLSVAALSGSEVHVELFSLTGEQKIGHIRLAREADLAVVAPATANLLAKMALGLADDLASTLLLATDLPILVAPAMNTAMWEHPATRANVAVLTSRGVRQVGPGEGAMACGEVGAGRMAEVAEIVAAAAAILEPVRPLQGRRALVTSGPTHERVDPVRFIANRSSGKQGHAVAGALARAGAEVTLVSGPVTLPDPPGVKVVRVETAVEMLAACREALPVDVAVCVAAVADWRVSAEATAKLSKSAGRPPVLELVENPDILATLAEPGPMRPALVVGFAAETDDLEARARAKLARKGCDVIVANDVSVGTGTLGGDRNTVLVVSSAGVEAWPTLDKVEVAERLTRRIAAALG